MRTLKAFVVGLIVGVMLLGATAVFAETQTIEAFYNNIKISIDGNVVELKDATGNLIDPFIYNGTTYLPVRAIAEALGMEVKYNETTNTVELTKIKEVKTVDVGTKTPPITIDDYKTVSEDEYLQVQVRPDGTRYIYPGSANLHLNRKAAKEYLQLRNEEHPELSTSSTVTIDIDTNNATIDFILRRFDGENIVIMKDVPTNNDCGTYLLPYDEYMNNILPKLIEAIKQNQ